ncbi:hypothetical protein GS610_04070 [Ruegeria sp. HKCCD6228]|jgi:hypothetical protein|uniref:hypothetical protein n=1 Tax=Ruegeria sp. HKCCD6228 TaxID=2683001 RepID=UPI0014917719|nr:hypothetical protein [Ruegeria sp. HKCCD6228]NOD96376.1 hypothetical protein [Ruegeria sp. HKCCD6228]
MFRALPKRLSSTERPNCAEPGADIPIIAKSGPSTELGEMGQFDHTDFVAAVQ